MGHECLTSLVLALKIIFSNRISMSMWFKEAEHRRSSFRSVMFRISVGSKSIVLENVHVWIVANTSVQTRGRSSWFVGIFSETCVCVWRYTVTNVWRVFVSCLCSDPTSVPRTPLTTSMSFVWTPSTESPPVTPATCSWGKTHSLTQTH